MSTFVTTGALSPEAILNGALSTIGSKQLGAARTIPVPRLADAPAAQLESVDTSSGDVAAVESTSGISATVVAGSTTGEVDPLKPVAERSVFTRSAKLPIPKPVRQRQERTAQAPIKTAPADVVEQASAEVVHADPVVDVNPVVEVIEAELVTDAPTEPVIVQEASAEIELVKEVAEVAPAEIAAAEPVEPAAKPASAPAKPDRRTLSQVKAQSQAKKVQGYDHKIVLNTFRIYAPLVAAVTYAPGRSGEARNTSEGIRVMRAEVDRLTKHFCSMIEVDHLDQDQQWVVSQFRALAAEHVAMEWKRNPDPQTFKVDEYSEAFEELLRNDAVAPDKFDFPGMKETVRVQISMMKSLEPTIREFAILENIVGSMNPDFRMDRSKLFTQCAELLFDEAKRLVGEMDIPDTDPSYLISFQSMLNRCGEPMAASVMYFSDRLIEQLDKMTPLERNAFFQKSAKEGRTALLDLNVIADDFRESTQALLDISFTVMEKYARGLKGPGL
ncbi:hypothetical protein ACKF11_13750 [Methylobacillus sp. Pita2]|uniref:hypothetical protein n=1 Tax=Methylobacillus sp. Pita2 TaxID=3383245 RepID=UPI0038B45879